MTAPLRRNYSPSGSGDFLILVDHSSSMNDMGFDYFQNGRPDYASNRIGWTLRDLAMVLALASAYEALEDGRNVVVCGYSNALVRIPVTGNPTIDFQVYRTLVRGGSTDMISTMTALLTGHDPKKIVGGETLETLGLDNCPDTLIITDGQEYLFGRPPQELLDWFRDATITCLHLLNSELPEEFHRGQYGEGALDLYRPGGPDWQAVSILLQHDLSPDQARKAVEDHTGRLLAVPGFFLLLMQETNWCGITGHTVEHAAKVIGRVFA